MNDAYILLSSCFNWQTVVVCTANNILLLLNSQLLCVSALTMAFLTRILCWLILTDAVLSHFKISLIYEQNQIISKKDLHSPNKILVIWNSFHINHMQSYCKAVTILKKLKERKVEVLVHELLLNIVRYLPFTFRLNSTNFIHPSKKNCTPHFSSYRPTS